MRVLPAQFALIIVGVIALATAVVLGWGLASGEVSQVKAVEPKRVVSGPQAPVSPAPIPPQPSATVAGEPSASDAKRDRGLPSNEALGAFLRGETETSVK